MRRMLVIVVIFILCAIIYGLIQSIVTLWNKQDVLVRTKKELVYQQNENKKLKEQLKEVEAPEFLEQEARNKLFLVRPGEQAVVIPKNLLGGKIQIPIEDKRSNWEQWYELFFMQKQE